MSSDHRNAAIQADLIEHFRLAKEILQLAYEHRPLPILAAFSHRIDKHIKGLKVGLNAGDEATKPLFIQQVIEPIFDQLANFGAPGGREDSLLPGRPGSPDEDYLPEPARL